MLLITNTSELDSQNGRVGLLVECAPDSALSRLGANQVPASELVGSLDEAKRSACRFVTQLLRSEPAVDGAYPLSTAIEQLTQELVRIIQAVRIDQWLTSHGETECVLPHTSTWFSGLKAVQESSESPYTLRRLDTSSRLGKSKLGRHVVDFGFSPKGLRLAAARLFNRLFPCGIRLLKGYGKAKPYRQPTGGFWFYSTSYTFSRIGSAYQPYVPGGMRFLIEDPRQGGLALTEVGQPWHLLYSFAKAQDVPSRRFLRESSENIRQCLQNAAVDPGDLILKQVFLRGGWLDFFCRRLLPLIVFQSRVLKRWLDLCRPEVIVCGNAAWERALLEQARARDIPTILLQHGIFGDFYQYLKYPLDQILVRGEFFRDFLCKENRDNAAILNFVEPAEPHRETLAGRREVLFLTAPYNFGASNLHELDLEEILSTLLSAAHRAGSSVAIRVHPVESVGYYSGMVNRLKQQGGFFAKVRFSQGGPMESDLRSAAVAVLFNSTAFMDCLRWKVPIVSFGWHDFSYRKLIEKYRVFNFARDLENLAELVREGIAGRLEPGDGVDRFAAPSSSVDLKEFFERFDRRTAVR